MSKSERLTYGVVRMIMGTLIAAAVLSIVSRADSAPVLNVTLAWDAVTTNTDGTPCTDLAGYRLYSRAATVTNWTPIVQVVGTNVAVVVPQSTVIYAVTALTTRGNESDYSEPLSITNTVPNKPVKPRR